MFDSLRPHGLYPTRLLCPQNFSGKKTGEDCHYPTPGHPSDPGIHPGLSHCRQTPFLKKFKFIYFNWRLITLQYCTGFAIHQHKSAMGIHMVSILNPPPTSVPVPSPWVIPVHLPQASCIMHQTWTGDSFLIWYYTCLNAILPNHPTLSLSHRVQKSALHICVSFAVSHTGLSSPSF